MNNFDRYTKAMRSSPRTRSHYSNASKQIMVIWGTCSVSVILIGRQTSTCLHCPKCLSYLVFCVLPLLFNKLIEVPYFTFFVAKRLITLSGLTDCPLNTNIRIYVYLGIRFSISVRIKILYSLLDSWRYLYRKKMK